MFCALFFLAGVPLLGDMFLYTPDSARYIIWARSLSVLDGFLDATGPDPVKYVIHAPLYSLLLTPWMWFSANSVLIAKLVTLIASVGLALLFYIWIRKDLGRTGGLVGSAFLLTNPLFLLFSTQALSEIPFAIVFILILIMLVRESEGRAESNFFPLLMGGLIACAYLLREVGVTIAMAAVVMYILKGEKRRALMVLLLPAIVYAVWFIRNEIIIAGLENPPIRNSTLFLSHFYTPEGSPILAEFGQRLLKNAGAYAELVGKLPLLAQFHEYGYGVIALSAEPYATVAGIIRFAQFIIVPCGVLLVSYGFARAWKESLVPRFILLFLGFYGILILLYPFYDMRFLFPLLLIMLYYMISGGKRLIGLIAQRWPAWTRREVIAAVIGIALIPNAAWGVAFLKNALSYSGSPDSFYNDVAGRRDYPVQFARPVQEVGEWIRENTDSAVTIGTRWKELVFYSGGRKVLELNPLIPPHEFASSLRDYHVDYLVLSRARNGILEFDWQMVFVDEFGFEPVFSASDLVVCRVDRHPRSVTSSGTTTSGDATAGETTVARANVRLSFREGLLFLKDGKVAQAESIFNMLYRQDSSSATIRFFSAVAFGLTGKSDAAERMFEYLSSSPQAGPYLVHSWYHLGLMRDLRSAHRTSDQVEQAELYHRLGLQYWNLGFESFASTLFGRSRQADPQYSRTWSSSTFLALDEENYKRAHEYLDSLEAISAFDPDIRPLSRILELTDALLAAQETDAKAQFHFELAQVYRALGMNSSAVDHLLSALELEPEFRQALWMLGDIYMMERRRGPARVAYERLAAVDPMSPAVMGRLKILADFW